MLQQNKRGLFSRLLPNIKNDQSSKQKRLSFASLSRSKDKSNMIQLKSIQSPKLGSHNNLYYSKPVQEETNRYGIDLKHRERERNQEYRLFSNISNKIKNQIKRQKQNIITNSNICNSIIKCNQAQLNKVVHQEYFGDPLSHPSKQKQHKAKPERPTSRQKIEKYFEQNPSLIRVRSDRSISSKKNKVQTVTNANTNSIMQDSKDKQNTYFNGKHLKIAQQCRSQSGMRLNIQNGLHAQSYRTFPPPTQSQYFITGRVDKQKSAKLQDVRQSQDQMKSSLDNVNMSASSIKFDMSPCF